MSDREPMIHYDPIYVKMMDMLREIGCDQDAVNNHDKTLVEIMNDLHNLRWTITRLKLKLKEANK